MKLHLASEKKQRSLAQDIIGESIEAEKAPFLFSREGGGEEIKEGALCVCPILVRRVADLLMQNERYSMSY